MSQMKLTPKEALEKAKQIYTEGVDYRCAIDSEYSFKVYSTDIIKYRVYTILGGHYQIFSSRGKGILYDSETDQWAEIIVNPNTLEILKQQEAELLEKLSDNRDKQRKIKLAEIEKKFGISVGDVIEYEGKKGIVSHIDANSANPFHYIPFKADGKPSMRAVWCYPSQIKLIEKCQPTT